MKVCGGEGGIGNRVQGESARGREILTDTDTTRDGDWAERGGYVDTAGEGEGELWRASAITHGHAPGEESREGEQG